ncbi:Afadin and alpha-actinin-binding-domain-containing protein [Gautieria morchelliformis]|nr:Afadin and alpha-actinin-binding-domain-containing protein [Gautieria morchelliformis]
MASVPGPSKKLLYDDTEITTPGTSFSLLSSEVYEPTSTLQYVNSQLVAHGFARSPGLSLDGLANGDSERIVKCILAMLSQRMEDLGRTEELGTKLRTITYEHERLQSIHHTAVDTGANAEREMNLFKSKLAASQRALTSELTAHKQTVSELQRTRTSLQYLRSTTQNELKRKDKEVERVLDRWNKVSDAQIKLSGTESGLRCANNAVGGEEYPKSKGLMEEALDQAEVARRELVKENEGFRSVILGTANALQSMVYNVKGFSTDVHVQEPAPLSHTAVFAPPTSSLLHPDNAHAKLRELMAAFREAVSGITAPNPPPSAKVVEDGEEVSKLKGLVESLRDELSQARQSSNCLATQAQEVLDKYTTHASERLVTGRDPTPMEAAEMSMELMGVLERDALRETLDRRAEALQTERDRFTEATVKLGKEKAELEAERLKLLEEKRRWAVDQMLAELPPTPGPDPDLASPPRPAKPKQLSPSPPRVRPRKVGGSKGTLKSPSKKTTLVRRTRGGITPIVADSLPPKTRRVRKENAKEEMDVLYTPEAQPIEATGTSENGLQRSTTPEEWPPATPPAATVAAEMKTSLPLVLPTTFTLPPPSPASSLAILDLGSISSNTSPSQPPPSPTVLRMDTIPVTTNAQPSAAPLCRPRIFLSPRTPRPLVKGHGKHAYSPARPSPLSRILMIADSPPSPPSVPPIQEENEETECVESRTDFARNVPPRRFLARELKLEAPIDEPSPLRERTGADLNGSVGAGTGVPGAFGQSKLMNQDEKRFTAKEKGKGRVVPVVNEVTAMEKENVANVNKVSRAGKAKATIRSSGESANPRVKPSKPVGSETRNQAAVTTNLKPPPINETTARTGTSRRPPRGPGGPSQSGNELRGVTTVRGGGARRVPIGSANAGKLGARKV